MALGLGAKNWTVQNCTHYFEGLCGQAFTRRKWGSFPGVGFLVDAHYGSKYGTQPLQDALVGAFSDEDYLFGGQRLDGAAHTTKVAITSTSTSGQVVILANYNRTGTPGQKRICCVPRRLVRLVKLKSTLVPYHFQRPDKLSAELKVWEAYVHFPSPRDRLC